MESGKNATYLTEKYGGRGGEEKIWTPCIKGFFDLLSKRDQKTVPVYACIEAWPGNGPQYEPGPEPMSVEGKISSEIFGEPVLEEIRAVFGAQLSDDRSYRDTSTGNIAGIKFDIAIVNSRGVTFIENKPYYGSRFGGNQKPRPDAAYIKFIQWLNKKEIPTRLIVIHSSSWKIGYTDVKKLNGLLDKHYGSVFLEDIFVLMHKENYRYEGIAESWGDYTSKSPDA